MKRVLIITYHFPPDAAMGAVRPAKFAKYLPEFGWEPVVYTLKEQHYEACDSDRLEPALKCLRVYRSDLIPGPLQIYSRLQQLAKRSRISSDSFAEVMDAKDHPKQEADGYLKRLAGSLLRLPDGDQGWILNIALQGRRILRENRIDVFVTSGPPMSTHLGGFLLKKATGIRWVADFRDPWASAPWETVCPSTALTRSLNRWLESKVVSEADSIVSTTDGTTRYFKSILPAREHNKCCTIPNGFDEDDFKSLSSQEYRKPRKDSRIDIIYAGTLYANRNPEPFFAALRKLIDVGQISEGSVDIQLIGDCLSFRGVSVPGLVEQYGLLNTVQIIGRVPYRECLDRMANASALLLFAQGQSDQIPGKVFDYLRINRPIFALAENGETRKILEPFANAFVADPTSLEDIATRFLKLLKVIRDGVTFLDVDGNIEQYSRRELTREFAGYLG